MALTSGTRLGPYEVVSLLGAGGMGEVYRARDTRLERDVAVKVLPTNLSSDPCLQQRSAKPKRFRNSLILTSARCMTLGIRMVWTSWLWNWSRVKL